MIRVSAKVNGKVKYLAKKNFRDYCMVQSPTRAKLFADHISAYNALDIYNGTHKAVARKNVTFENVMTPSEQIEALEAMHIFAGL